jgi:hypothetical protein
MLHLTVSWDGDPEDLLIAEQGVSEDGPVSLFRDVVADERFRPDLLVLVDARGSDYRPVSWDMIGQRVDSFAAAVGHAPDLRIAVAAVTSVDFGLWRTWGSLVESRCSAQVHVADSLDGAREWLRSELRSRSEARS